MIQGIHSNPKVSHCNSHPITASGFKNSIQKQNLHNDMCSSNAVSFTGSKQVKSLFSCVQHLENLKMVETLKDLTEVEDYPLRKIFAAARKFVSSAGNGAELDKKTLNKETKGLIEKVIDFVQNPGQKADEAVQKFLETDSNGKTVETFLDDVKNVTKHKDIETIKEILEKDDKDLVPSNFNISINYESDRYKNLVKKSVNEAVDILNFTENAGKLYTSRGVEKILEKAEKNQLVFNAMFSAILACAVRPATIVALPGKKNKDDKKYAAAHSVASGVMGYLEALIIATPIAAAVALISKKPTKYLTEATMKFIENKKPAQAVAQKARRVAREAMEFADNKRFSVASKYLNMVPGFISAIPQAMLTVALTPPVLKYVFGLDKSKPVQKPVATTPNITAQNYALIGFKSASEPTKKVFHNFMGGAK